MYEAIVKYIIQGMECVKQRINPVCAKFHFFSKIIKGVPFPERSMFHSSQFYRLLIAQVAKYIAKFTMCTFYAISQDKM